ncbi:enoyl-CoA hydratase/isomerase family protein [bacterium]|nr:enoyl-CoA hydratase/isomerase family protein [bacterium]MBU1073349.1 enoyl-CoA hydratase/isomerase family protein [bacterium]MBU1677099.1 enoyl-CoA hydratase/isomerase family protein [bacterium]
MAYKTLLLDVSDGIALVTINRPDKMNALNAELVGELHDCFGALRRDDAARVVILTGAGDKAFVAGADIGELADVSGPELERLAERGQSLMWNIENLGKPVIAAVNGFALGGGCELALACTFRYASENAKLGLPEVTLGLIPGYGGTQRLPRLVGRGIAAEMILTGGMVDAAEAARIGLVNMVFKPEKLLDAARNTAAAIATRSGATLRYALKAMGEGSNMSLDAGCRLEAGLFGVVGSLADAKEGCRAFLEKRKPAFEDR